MNNVSKIFIFPKSLYEQLKSEFPKKNIGQPYAESETEYYLEEWYLDKLVESLEGFNQWFMDEFSKSAKPYFMENCIYPYRIRNIISDEFKSYPIENIDFTIHLKPQIALNKINKNMVNGRPVTIEYEFEGTIYARRRFEFTLNSETSFPERRREWLAYYREDGELGEEFLIKDNIYDLESESDDVMKELEQARKNIVQQLKSLVYKNVRVADPTMTHTEALMKATSFFNDYSSAVSTFVETGLATGTPEMIIDKIQADTTTVLLSEPYFDNPQIPLKAVLISILSY